MEFFQSWEGNQDLGADSIRGRWGISLWFNNERLDKNPYGALF